jgi:hypothetical protein
MGTYSESPAVHEEARTQMERYCLTVRCALGSAGQTAESDALRGYNRELIRHGSPPGILEHAPKVVEALVNLGYSFTETGEPPCLRRDKALDSQGMHWRLSRTPLTENMYAASNLSYFDVLTCPPLLTPKATIKASNFHLPFE